MRTRARERIVRLRLLEARLSDAHGLRFEQTNMQVLIGQTEAFVVCVNDGERVGLVVRTPEKRWLGVDARSIVIRREKQGKTYFIAERSNWLNQSVTKARATRGHRIEAAMDLRWIKNLARELED